MGEMKRAVEIIDFFWQSFEFLMNFWGLWPIGQNESLNYPKSTKKHIYNGHLSHVT